MDNIRNFCIIAHIDHGKSTLADRMLELTGVIHTTDNKQVLDSMDLERERGITIKAKSVRMPYQFRSGGNYILNLIDTPGHVDFNYEVSRSLKACEGAVLLVDASQGVEAQTIANAYLAIDAGLEIIHVINKIDLPNAIIDECRRQLEDMLGLSGEDALLVSAKTGAGVPELLEAIVSKIPSPQVSTDEPLKCLVFDSYYDPYRGVIPHIRLFSGSLHRGDKIMVKSTSKVFDVDEVGYFLPQLTPCQQLAAGEVGYVGATIREVGDIHVGDTIISPDFPETQAISGSRRSQPMVFCGIYPVNSNDYGKLAMALEKFQLNDSSIAYEKESSAALGHGYRLGFMGMLHMEITLERLKREYGQELIATMPSVVYKVFTTSGESVMIDNPSRFPAAHNIDHIEEPIIRARIIVLSDLVGPCMELSESKRGTLVTMEYPDRRRTLLTYDFPLAEIITGYYDKLKSVSRGYASMDYDFAGYRRGDLVKVDVLVKENQVDALSFISVRDSAVARARVLIHKLRKVIPRHLFEVPLQAVIGGKVIAREDIAPIRKDVLAKCYGGDISRKRKLLEKQKEGKKRMKIVGSVEIPQEAFLLLLKAGE
ncbi:translation elongation factor 4 [Patescibacteria group bacterium]|nr:translation elongation factor 4 [Patescibacteria group bacterium]